MLDRECDDVTMLAVQEKEEIVERAASRRHPSTSYAGDLLPSEAWSLLSSHDDAVLVDVRTQPEWSFVGTPDLRTLHREVLPISWRLDPDMTQNISFVEELAHRMPNVDVPLLFLCRTGVRSQDAAQAMAARGYTQCFNIIFGFEGDGNEAGRRGEVNGWKAERLPWCQA